MTRKYTRRSESVKPPTKPPTKLLAEPKTNTSDTFTINQTYEYKPPAVCLHDLAEKGPVHLLQGEKGMGLLIHHLNGRDSVNMQSLTTGQGFVLSRESARVLGALLTIWAEGDTFALAG